MVQIEFVLLVGFSFTLRVFRERSKNDDFDFYRGSLQRGLLLALILNTTAASLRALAVGGSRFTTAVVSAGVALSLALTTHYLVSQMFTSAWRFMASGLWSKDIGPGLATIASIGLTILVIGPILLWFVL